jgi:8-hydroxy-5-deazaflavin:NADPH oxidoreductase
VWSAEAVFLCALHLLGRSEQSFPPVRFVETVPAGVSPSAQAFVQPPDTHIVLVTSSWAFVSAQGTKERCGDLQAIREIAGVLVHEECHVRHGADEERAYNAQLMALLFVGVRPDSPLYGRVMRAKQAVVAQKRLERDIGRKRHTLGYSGRTHQRGASDMKTIGLIGAGHIGSQLARLAVGHGYKVVLSNSRAPESLAGLVVELGPNARAATPVEAAAAGDIVVVTIPLKNIKAVPVAPLAGKIVIDTNNYYPQRDGHIPELDNESTTTAELLQAHLPASKVVKAFNHIYAAELTTHGQPAGTKNRRALVIAGNDAQAKAAVAQLIDEFGFDTVDAGPLREGWRIQRDTPGYGPRRTAEELRRDLASARRYAEMTAQKS